MGTTIFKKDLYKIAIDENEDLDTRWEALGHLRDHRLHNPHLGDIEEFIKANQGLVGYIAKSSLRKTRHRVEFEDLMQEGNIGLIKAYCYFDPSDKNYAFSTYATYHISNEMTRYIRDRVPAFKTPRNIHELSGKILKRKMRELTAEEISKELGCTVKAANNALENLKEPKIAKSLNAIIGNQRGDNQSTEYMDIMPVEEDFSSIHTEEFKNVLTEKQIQVMDMVIDGMTQKQIGEVMGYTKAYAGRILQQVRERAVTFFGNEGIA